MIYIGISVAKQDHFASLVFSDGEILVEPFQFSNGGDGFYYLISVFEPFVDKEIIIGLGLTTHYVVNLIRYLDADGYNDCVLSPLYFFHTKKSHQNHSYDGTEQLFLFILNLLMEFLFVIMAEKAIAGLYK